MKDIYEKPVAEKIVFSYREQVVAASGAGASGSCNWNSHNSGYDACDITWTGNNA